MLAKWVVRLEKAGTNPDQAPHALITSVTNPGRHLKVGEAFHVEGQPDDVWWRVAEIINRR